MRRLVLLSRSLRTGATAAAVVGSFAAPFRGQATYAQGVEESTSASSSGGDTPREKAQAKEKGENQKEEAQAKTDALGTPSATGKRRNIVVLSNTTKAVYIHPANHIASWYWFITDFHKWFVGIVFLFVGSQLLARYRLSKLKTVVQAQLGENLLDQRTRDLLSDIEVLRRKDPLRLEQEANVFHEQFWKRRAIAVSESRNEVRRVELQRGMLQGQARGTDMTEWLGAKAKDDEEREVARRTQDYIQGFHQHLKSKRLI
ncbi:uncharacterized protein Tco025E_01912 [Trypanosoma conorhini]|uniref:Uncharacterized protein n=1 Tax=Trypanosoma conorhini TaxID=83891 RepID=A0A422Q7H1_9TRYP|nr:uncharacterized protein Tco025E_01912 [Trypanosoma conorhini]RNF25908.1 hypothetical protein Tco025E_01912 [Trypanosoma conorhini]